VSGANIGLFQKSSNITR